METLELTLPAIPALASPRGLPKLKPRPNYQPPSVQKQKSKTPPKVPMLKLRLPLPLNIGEKKKTSKLFEIKVFTF
jgi:hypothetical protein